MMIMSFKIPRGRRRLKKWVLIELSLPGSVVMVWGGLKERAVG